MGSITYCFLADSILFHESNLESDFKDLPLDRLNKEIQDYRDYCVKNFDELCNEIHSRQSFLKVFAHQGETSLDLLKQMALYIDQFVVPDPIFAFSGDKSNIGDITGYGNYSLDKRNLAQSVRFLKGLTPMIAADYVKIFPKSLYFERPEGIPLTYPQNNYNDILSRDILDFLRQRAVVKSMEKGERGWKILKELFPCRSIFVDFKGEEFSNGMMYHLYEIDEFGYDEQKGEANLRYSLPDTIPDQIQFETWINQSLNSMAKAYYDKVFTETKLSASLNTTYLTNSALTHEFLTKNFGVDETIQTYTANQLLKIDLPFIDNVDVSRLMAIREYEADTFTSFRIELEKYFRELRTLTDEEQIKLKRENIFHELETVQGQKIKQKLNNVKKQFGLNALLAVGGLAGSIVTSGFSLAATALAIGKGYKDFLDYKEKVKENPAYLLWQVKKKK